MSKKKTKQKEKEEEDEEELKISEMRVGEVCEGTFEWGRPPAPGYPVYTFRVRLDSGEIKFLLVDFFEFRRCCEALDLKVGDRIRVRNGKEDWEVWKLE